MARTKMLPDALVHGWRARFGLAVAVAVAVGGIAVVDGAIANAVEGGLTINATLIPTSVNAPSEAEWKLDVINDAYFGPTLDHVSVEVSIDAGSFDLAGTNQNSPGATCHVVVGEGSAASSAPITDILCQLGNIQSGNDVVVNALIGTAKNLSGDTINASAFANSEAPGPVQSDSAFAALHVDPPAVGQNSGFVPPGGTISTGKIPTPDNNTVIIVTLPVTEHQSGTGASPASTDKVVRSPGAALDVSGADGSSVLGFCGGAPCDGKIMTLAPFSGYGDPTHPVKIVLKWLAGLVGTSTALYGQKPPDPSFIVPACAKKVADRIFPCLLRHVVNRRTGAVTDTVLTLSGDPSFARKR